MFNEATVLITGGTGSFGKVSSSFYFQNISVKK